MWIVSLSNVEITHCFMQLLLYRGIMIVLFFNEATQLNMSAAVILWVRNWKVAVNDVFPWRRTLWLQVLFIHWSDEHMWLHGKLSSSAIERMETSSCSEGSVERGIAGRRTVDWSCNKSHQFQFDSRSARSQKSPWFIYRGNGCCFAVSHFISWTSSTWKDWVVLFSSLCVSHVITELWENCCHRMETWRSWR